MFKKIVSFIDKIFYNFTEFLLNLCSDLWKDQVELNLSAGKIVQEKFDLILQEICKNENIKIKYFNTIEELNIQRGGKDLSNKEDLAAGVYGYRLDENNKLIINEKLPYIYLITDYNFYTFAHELGHHFAIKDFSDHSEKCANNFIFTFAQKYLTNLEICIINISLKVFSETEFDIPEIKRRDWINFKKEHKIV